MTTPPGFTPPLWDHCEARGGCPGRRVDPHPLCLAHLPPAELTRHLAGLAPGADVDHRGTTLDQPLLDRLLTAVRDPADGNPRFGRASFENARFTGDVLLGEATFTGEAHFEEAVFDRDTYFYRAKFAEVAQFRDTAFTGEAAFHGAVFAGGGQFAGATFMGDVGFDGATFVGLAWFHSAKFTNAPVLGPLVCTTRLVLSGAVFSVPVTIDAAAATVVCRRTRWEATATLRLRYAELDLSNAVVTQPLAVTTHPTPLRDTEAAEATHLTGDPRVRVVSLRGVDAIHVVLTDTDLTRCRFSGAFHLDQIRLEGRTLFAAPPAGTRRRGGFPTRWTQRRVLAEEHAWRALGQPPADPAAPTAAEWTPGPDHPDPVRTPGPDDLAPVYRALRKAFEDAKNEPDAADFYYGEMEMRRHDTTRPRAERRLLTAYWALSGYGLRASRALAWLGVAMCATVLALMLWGLPGSEPKAETKGTQVLPGREFVLTTDTPSPELRGPVLDRVTVDRAEKAVRVVLNSVVFRASGQNLTTAGTYTEMVSRFTEPLLLALAVLAVRGRVRR